VRSSGSWYLASCEEESVHPIGRSCSSVDTEHRREEQFRSREYRDVIVTITLRDGVDPPADAPWLKHGEHYTAVVILVADKEAAVRILGPDGARCVMSTRDVRRLADDWPDH
jgi:hypothetical protein